MSKQQPPITVALADDHILMRNALAVMIENFGNCKVILEASHGKELIKAIKAGTIPQVLILDQNMPVMDGFEVSAWLHKNHPQVRILMLTMYDSDITMVKLLRNGVRGFLKKNVQPSELKLAIESVMTEDGLYYTDHLTERLLSVLRNPVESLQKTVFSDMEIEFLKLCTTDMTYKEIAEELKINPRKIDSVRSKLFDKLEVNHKIGLVMVALKHGLVSF